MRPLSTRVLSAVAVIALALTCMALVPSSSATNYTNGQYGDVESLDTVVIDQMIKAETGKTMSEWVVGLTDPEGKYGVTEFDPVIKTEFSLRRDTSLKGHEYTIKDHYSGYIEATLDFAINGNYPASGTYEAKDNETTLEMLYRVFEENGSSKKTDNSLKFDIKLYVDLALNSHVDMNTGEITDSYVTIRFLMYDYEDRTIDLDIVTDEDDNPQSVTITYDRILVDSMLYANWEVGLTIQGLKVFSCTDPSWQVKPVIKEHVYRSAVSSDLADSIWMEVLDAADGEMGDVELPELILKLLGSGGRMMDVFDTIKSLTSADMPDISFTATLDASNGTDDGGYECCILESLKSSGPTFNLSTGAYMLNLNQVIDDIPDYMLSTKVKNTMKIIVTALGWNHIDVKDISGDDETKGKSDVISEYVNKKIDVVEVTHYSIPPVYVMFAGFGIIATIVCGVLIWRRPL